MEFGGVIFDQNAFFFDGEIMQMCYSFTNVVAAVRDRVRKEIFSAVARIEADINRVRFLYFWL
jgi:hypothetical protein